jgi:hypothetical protein
VSVSVCVGKGLGPGIVAAVKSLAVAWARRIGASDRGLLVLGAATLEFFNGPACEDGFRARPGFGVNIVVASCAFAL